MTWIADSLYCTPDLLLVAFSLAVQVHAVLDFVYALFLGLFTLFFIASLLFYQLTAFLSSTVYKPNDIKMG